MSDFIEVTSLDIKCKRALININHISDIQENDKGEVRIYLTDGSTSYPVKETYDELVMKIKKAQNSSFYAVCDTIIEDGHSNHPQYAGTTLLSNQKEYEEQVQNQGYTIV